MSDILIRGMDQKAVQRLKMRAKRNGRSLQGEAKLILEQAAGQSLPEVLAAAQRWRTKLGKVSGKRFSSSADLIREDRAR
jgi:antitoxin FitA